MLKDHGTLRPRPGDLFAIDQHTATAGLIQACHHPHAGGLAAAGRPHDSHELLVSDHQVNASDRQKFLATLHKGTLDCLKTYVRHQ